MQSATHRATATTIDDAEVARFSAIAAEWWDESGKFAPLHKLNPARISYLRDQIIRHFSCTCETATPLKNLSLVDIGCGGGLISEPMARLGAQVTGIDASQTNIQVASLHAKNAGVTIDYRAATAEQLSLEGAQFDVVLALEIIEHVADVELFYDCLRRPAHPLHLEPHRKVLCAGDYWCRICVTLAAQRHAYLVKIHPPFRNGAQPAPTRANRARHLWPDICAAFW